MQINIVVVVVESLRLQQNKIEKVELKSNIGRETLLKSQGKAFFMYISVSYSRYLSNRAFNGVSQVYFEAPSKQSKPRGKILM